VDEQPKETQGFHDVLVTESYHPFWSNWWPQGHIIGWEHTFVHELTHFLDCIVNKKNVAPYGATFEDGYRAAVICDAILESANAKNRLISNTEGSILMPPINREWSIIMAYLLGLDVSTTGAKALLIDERGDVVASATTEYPLSTPRPLWSEQAPADWW